MVSLPAYLEGGDSVPSLEEAMRHAKVLKALLRRAHEEKDRDGRVSALTWDAVEITLDNMIEALPPIERSYDVRGG